MEIARIFKAMEIARIFEAMEIARNSSFKVYEKLIDVFYAVPAIFRSNGERLKCSSRDKY